MITLMEMLRNEKADPAHGRPLDITRIYMANVMSSREAVLLAKKQKLAAGVPAGSRRPTCTRTSPSSRAARSQAGGMPKVCQRRPGSWASRRWGSRR